MWDSLQNLNRCNGCRCIKVTPNGHDGQYDIVVWN